MGDWTKQPIRRAEKIQNTDLSITPNSEATDASYQRIADELSGLAGELRSARTALQKREILGALLWNAESIRRTLEAEQNSLLRGMSDRPQ